MGSKCFADFSEVELVDLFGQMDSLSEKDLETLLSGHLEDLKLSKRQKMLEAVRLDERLYDLSRMIKDGMKPEAALTALFTRDISGRSRMVSLERRQQEILASAHAQLADMMEDYRPKKFGFARDREGPRNIIRHLFGQRVNDTDAVGYAGIWKKVTEDLRVRFNAAGGDIKYLEDWMLPQSHDPLRVGKVSKDEWVSFIRPLLDEERLTNAQGKRLTDAEIDDMLSNVYDTISTDGMVKFKPGERHPNAKGKTASRHQEHRYLHFKDAEGWLAYQDKFGRGDIYSSMTDHLDLMSREIANMEMLGPNPDKSFQFLKDVIAKQTGKRDAGSFAERVWANLNGSTAAVNRSLADSMRSLRNIETATKLGSAMLSAISDTVFQALAAYYNGVPVLKVATRFLKTLTVDSAENRKLAGRLHLLMEYAVDGATTANRYSEVTGHSFTARWADATMRMSGLSHWTYTGRQAFGLEMLANLANHTNKNFDRLPRRMRRALRNYGITADDWAKIKRSPKLIHKGTAFLDPENMDMDLRRKVVGMVLEETDYAVPTPNARIRAILNQGTAQGTVTGEMWRAMGQFKSFPATALINQMGRALTIDGPMERISYTASLLVGTTVLGMIAYNAKEVSKGRKPIEMNGDLVKAGLMQGGGLGIAADFLFSDVTRYGQSFTAMLAGPVAGDVEEIAVKFLLGTAQDVIGLEQDALSRASAAGARIAQKMTPGRLWYTRLALDRYIYDNLNKLADDKWHEKQRRLARKREKTFGNEYYWKPGDLTPRGK